MSSRRLTRTALLDSRSTNGKTWNEAICIQIRTEVRLSIFNKIKLEIMNGIRCGGDFTDVHGSGVCAFHSSLALRWPVVAGFCSAEGKVVVEVVAYDDDAI